jgi:transposase
MLYLHHASLYCSEIMPVPQTTRDEIIGAFKVGACMTKIASTLDVPLTSVHNTIQRYKDTGSSQSRPKTGRPPKITPQTKRAILRDITNDPSKPWKDYGAERGISRDSVKRIAEEEGFHKRHARAKPFLRPVHVEKRLQWAMDYENMDWRTVIFTDEVSFEMGKRGGITWTIRRVGEEFKQKHIQLTFRQGRKTIMVWGAIAHGHKWPLHRLIPSQSRPNQSSNTINTHCYVNQILMDRLAGYCSEMRREGMLGVKVVEDGAPIHNTKLAGQVREETHIKRIEHPPSSPDLNAIEPLWGIVKHRVSLLRPVASTTDKLWEQIEQVWDELEQDIVDRQVERMGARVRAVKEAKGMHTQF